MPPRLLVTLVTVTALVATVLVGWFVVFPAGSGKGEWLKLVWIFIPCWILLLIVFRLTKVVRLETRDMLQFSGQRGPTLVVRGNTRGSKSHIPFHLIEDVTEVTFEGPWWRTVVTGAPADSEEIVTADKPVWWRTFLSLRDEHEKVPVSTTGLFGYSGPGLLVTYRAGMPISGGKEILWKQQFPTQAPGRLKLLLEPTDQPD